MKIAFYRLFLPRVFNSFLEIKTERIWGLLALTAKGAVEVFELICHSAEKFLFYLKGTNGQIIAVSQSYLTRQSAEKGIASVKKNAPMAKVVDQTVTLI